MKNFRGSIWSYCKVLCDVLAKELSRLEYCFQFNKIKKEKLQLALCVSGVVLSSTNPRGSGDMLARRKPLHCRLFQYCGTSTQLFQGCVPMGITSFDAESSSPISSWSWQMNTVIHSVSPWQMSLTIKTSVQHGVNGIHHCCCYCFFFFVFLNN